MLKYKVKNTKKPYDKSTSHENSAPKVKLPFSRPKNVIRRSFPYKLKRTLLKSLHQWNQASAVNVRSLDAVLYSVNAAI